MKRLPLIVTLWGFVAGICLAADLKLAERTPFAVPLADGQTGTAMLLDSQQIVVAAPGTPPRLSFFTITPRDTPPIPPPGPGPGPGPQPPPGPSGPLTLLWIEESQSRTTGQARALTDRPIREALAAAGWTLRVIDQDITDETGKTPPELASAIAQAKAAGLPYLIVRKTDGAEVFAGKAPEDETQFRQLLARLGLRMAEPAPPQTTTPDGQAIEKDKEQDACPSGQCPTTSKNTASSNNRVYYYRPRR